MYFYKAQKNYMKSYGTRELYEKLCLNFRLLNYFDLSIDSTNYIKVVRIEII